MKKFLFGALAIAILMAGCGGGGKSSVIKAGWLGSLTGDQAVWGEGLFHVGAELAPGEMDFLLLKERLLDGLQVGDGFLAFEPPRGVEVDALTGARFVGAADRG